VPGRPGMPRRWRGRNGVSLGWQRRAHCHGGAENHCRTKNRETQPHSPTPRRSYEPAGQTDETMRTGRSRVSPGTPRLGQA